jgi:hypothetical protein
MPRPPERSTPAPVTPGETRTTEPNDTRREGRGDDERRSPTTVMDRPSAAFRPARWKAPNSARFAIFAQSDTTSRRAQLAGGLQMDDPTANRGRAEAAS